MSEFDLAFEMIGGAAIGAWADVLLVKLINWSCKKSAKEKQ